MARLLAFTDPHRNLEAAASILKLHRKERPDAVVCSGDFSYFGEEYEEFLARLQDLECDVHFVSGNHEDRSTMQQVRASYAFMKDLEYRTVEVAGAVLAGVPGSEEFWPSGRSYPGEAERALTLIGPVDRSKPLVLLSHFPPWKSAIAGLRIPTPDSGGTRLVSEIVAKLRPSLVICGHYHQDFGREDVMDGVRLVNPGPSGQILEV